MRRRACLPDTNRERERDEKDVVMLVEKPDKMCLKTTVGPDLRVSGQPKVDVGREVEGVCVS